MHIYHNISQGLLIFSGSKVFFLYLYRLYFGFFGDADPDDVMTGGGGVTQKRNISGYKVGKNKIPLINLFIFRISFILGNFKKLKRIFLKMRIVEILERFTLFNTEIINSNPDNVREVYNNQFMEKKVKTLLKKSYKKDIEKLEILIEKNLECWK